MAPEKVTRYSTTEYNRSERVLRRLRDIYSRAQSFHLTHDQLLELLDAEIYKTRDYQKLTAYYRGMYAGTHRTLRDFLYQYEIAWRVRLDGILMDSKDVPKGRWSDVTMGAHVWADAPDKLFSSEGDK